MQIETPTIVARTAPSRKARFRRVHKWVAITVGLVLFIWVASGLVIVLPPPSAPPAAEDPVDFRQVVVSPAEAAAALGVDPARVRWLNLVRLGDDVAYRVQVQGTGVRLVDAVTGAPFTIDAARAERIVRAQYPSVGAIRSVERVTEYDLAYLGGPLPAYRLVPESGDALFHVAEVDGVVRYSDRVSRVRAAITMWHDLHPVRVLLGPGVHRLSMLVFSAGSVVVVLTGFYLALPRRRSAR